MNNKTLGRLQKVELRDAWVFDPIVKNLKIAE
jgi:hypothetical protein